MTELSPTPSQTVGPFFGYALPYEGGPEVAPVRQEGAITVRGRILDGAGDPVPDALVEIWQADGSGEVPRRTGGLRREGHGFSGFGRCGTDAAGGYWFSTLRPGAAGGDAPHISVLVFARGLLKPVVTRLYVPDAAAEAEDPTMVARADGDGLRFDVHLQGDRETAFFEL